MRSNISDSRTIRRSLGVLGLMAVAGLAAGIMLFAGYKRQIDSNERNTELTKLMVETVQSDLLLRELNSGQSERAKARLQSALVYELGAIRLAAATAKPQEQNSAKVLLAQIGREQQTHPEYYLASIRKTGFDRTGKLQVVQH